MWNIFKSFKRATRLQAQDPQGSLADANGSCPQGYRTAKDKAECQNALQGLKVYAIDSAKDLKDGQFVTLTVTKEECERAAKNRKASLYAYKPAEGANCRLPKVGVNDPKTMDSGDYQVFRAGQGTIIDNYTYATSGAMDPSRALTRDECYKWAADKGITNVSDNTDNSGPGCVTNGSTTSYMRYNPNSNPGRPCGTGGEKCIMWSENAENLKGCYLDKATGQGAYNKTGVAQRTNQHKVCLQSEGAGGESPTSGSFPWGWVIGGIVTAVVICWYVLPNLKRTGELFGGAAANSRLSTIAEEELSALTRLSQL
jgi:hypothetical protein